MWIVNTMATEQFIGGTVKFSSEILTENEIYRKKIPSNCGMFLKVSMPNKTAERELLFKLLHWSILLYTSYCLYDYIITMIQTTAILVRMSVQEILWQSYSLKLKHYWNNNYTSYKSNKKKKRKEKTMIHCIVLLLTSVTDYLSPYATTGTIKNWKLVNSIWRSFSTAFSSFDNASLVWTFLSCSRKVESFTRCH